MTNTPWLGSIALVLILGATVPAPSAAPPKILRDQYGDPLPFGAVARFGTTRYRLSSSQAMGLGFTPDGNTLVAASPEGIEVFEAKTGRRVRNIRVDFYVRNFALSRDGKLAAVTGDRSRSRDTIVRVVNVADGKEVRSWTRSNERGDMTLAFSPDGKLLASLSDEMFRLEEIRSGEELLRHRFGGGSRAKFAFSADGASLAVATWPTVFTWRWKQGEEPVALGDTSREATSISFSPDGKTLAVGVDADGGIRRWDLGTRKQLKQLGASLMIRAVSYSPDGKYLVSTDYDRTLILWDAKTGDEVRKLPHRGRYVRSVAFSHDSHRIATLDEGVIRIWEVATGKDLAAADSHSRAPNFVRFLKDDVAVTSGDDGTVRFWDTRSGKQTKRIDVAQDWVRATAVSPDGRWMTASELGEKHAVSLWDLKTGKRIYRLAGHGRLGGMRALAFTPDSKRLASWGDDQYLRLWDVKKGKAIEEHAIRPDGKGGPLDDVDPLRSRIEMSFFQKGRLSADARLFAMQSADSVFVFDVVSGKQMAKLPAEIGMLQDAAFSPDNKSLLVAAWGRGRFENIPGGGQRLVHTPYIGTVFDIAKGTASTRLNLADEWPDAVAWRPDGKRFALAFVSPKPYIRFFDGGKPVGKIDLQARPWALSYSPDGKRILVSLADTTAVVFNVPAE